MVESALEKVVAGCGCFMLVVAVLLFVVFGAIKSSLGYVDGVLKAKAHQQVRSVLGEPIAESSFVAGKINTAGGVTTVDISVDLSGPKGEGTLKIEASCKGEQCIYQKRFFFPPMAHP